MKKLIFFSLLFMTTISCQTKESAVSPKYMTGSARQIGTANLESWGGITLQIVRVYDPNTQKSVIDHYEGFWGGVTVRFRNVSYEIVPNPGYGYGKAWGEFSNESEMASSGVNVLNNGTSGFALQQLNTGPSGGYGQSPEAGANLSVESSIGQIDWYPDPTQYYVKSDGIFDAVAEALHNLKDELDRRNEDAKASAEVDRLLNSLNMRNENLSIVTTYNDYSYLIQGRLVVKPNGDIGIVPLTWLCPTSYQPPS